MDTREFKSGTPLSNLPALEISPAFMFTQSSLQDISDCRRRFYLRYLLHLAWPAPEAEPIHEIEQQLLLGAAFHNIVYQFYIGIPIEKLLPQTQVEPLSTWWENFLTAQSNDPLFRLPDARYRAEHTMIIPFHKFRLLAKYDLLIEHPVQDGGAFFIIDWKTSAKRSKRAVLEQRLQTIVYPFLYEQAKLSGDRSAKLEMIYWNANFPDSPERFEYSHAQTEISRQKIATLIDLVTKPAGTNITVENRFPMTHDERHCRFCSYRSLCNRGTKAGNLTFSESELDFESDDDLDDFAKFTLENISEIEF